MSSRVELSRAVQDASDWNFDFRATQSAALPSSRDGAVLHSFALDRDKTERFIWAASGPVYTSRAYWFDAKFDGELRFYDDNIIVLRIPLQWNGTSQPLAANTAANPCFVTFSSCDAFTNLTAAGSRQPNLRIWPDGAPVIGDGGLSLYPTCLDLPALAVRIRAQRAELVSRESAVASGTIFITGMAVLSQYP